MHDETSSSNTPKCLILIGCGIFVLILAISAVWEPDIRRLHFFQSWMYLATAFLTARRRRLGYFVGISAAGLWDYANLFATSFFFNGLQQLSGWIQTGHLLRPDLLNAVPAWLSNLLIVVGSIWGYSRLSKKPARDAIALAMTFLITTGFLALDMALFQPRYLALFSRMLHPHLPD